MNLGRPTTHAEELCPLGKDYRNLAKFAKWLKLWRPLPPQMASRGAEVKSEVAGRFASCSLDFEYDQKGKRKRGDRDWE